MLDLHHVRINPPHDEAKHTERHEGVSEDAFARLAGGGCGAEMMSKGIAEDEARGESAEVSGIVDTSLPETVAEIEQRPKNKAPQDRTNDVLRQRQFAGVKSGDERARYAE